MITIPEIHENPLLNPEENGIVPFTDYVFGEILGLAPILAYAELKEKKDEIEWSLSQPSGSVSKIPTRCFRTFLARIGHHYLSGQVYGGNESVNVRFKNETYEMRISVKNQSNFSVEIEAQKCHPVAGINSVTSLRDSTS